MDSAAFHPRRSLATQMTAQRAYDYDVHFDFELNPEIPHPVQSSTLNPQTPRPEQSPTRSPSDDMADFLPMRPWDPQSVIMHSEPIPTKSAKLRVYNGIGGEITQMFFVLQGCLCVGRLKRAQAIIKRLSRIDSVDVTEEELVRINQEYVRVAVERLVADPNDEDAQDLHKWFELEIRQSPFYYDVLAYMLKASLREPSAQKRKRLIHRYMSMVPENMTKETQIEYGILTEKELDLVHGIWEGRKTKVDLDQITEQQEADTAMPIRNLSITDEYVPEGEMAKVRPAAQKGLGLETLKNSLSVFTDEKDEFLPSNLTSEQQRDRQKLIEESAVRSAIDRWREEHSKMVKMGINTALQDKSLGARMWKWHTKLQKYIEDELNSLDAAEASGSRSGSLEERMNLSVTLRLLPTDQLAAITILTIMNKLGSQGMDRGVPLSGMIVQVGRAVEDECMAFRIMNIAKASPTRGNRRGGAYLIKKLKYKRGEARLKLPDEFEKGAFAGIANEPWTLNTTSHVGAFLITGLIKTALIPVTRVNPKTEELMTQVQPAFIHTQQYKMGKKVGVLMSNQYLVEQLKKEPVHSLLARHLPMVVKPEPWTHFKEGGFISQPVRAIRIKHTDKEQRHYAVAAIERGDLEQIFKGLDVLGSTSWKINRPVLRVMLEIWNSGAALANIPPAEANFSPIPKPPADADPLIRKQYLKDVKAQENLKGSIHSQRCFQNFQMEIARALRNDVFYFPHNLDFRGRAYPVPPLFNHMGADHCRGLLKFGEGRELGESGLKWVKVHLSNVFGYDKASLSEREAFADEHLDDILDSATNPLEGRRWWLEGENPWQTLAACVELKDALDSPDPTKFMSSLPCHQDGTCNGLQHYAALGGDEWGAKQVNLEPGDRPADVYSAVADLVKEGIAQDLAKGSKLAKVLNGKINRKVVKQTVMTNVYGVTFIGARAQVKKQLVALYKDLPDDPDCNPGILAAYVANKIFASLSTMFSGAHDIQHWLGACAHRIVTSMMPEQIEHIMNEFEVRDETLKPRRGYSPPFDTEVLMQFKSGVIWTTPLHMPVVQPYRTSKSRIVKTSLQQISLSEPQRSDPVSRRKQLQGFPPNFIHSLDATHMILSALRCHDLGMSFAAVHDSFWTHAADIDKMNDVLRDAFIRVHSEDVIGRLAAEFDVRYKGAYRYLAVKPGSLLVPKLVELRKSKDFLEMRDELIGDFRPKTMLDRRAEELLIETKVARMLQSTDSAIVAKAKKWKTCGQLAAEFAAQEDVEVPAEEMADIGVGTIPTSQASLRARPYKSIQLGDAENVEEDPGCHPYPNIESETGMDSDDPILNETEDDVENEAEAEAEDIWTEPKTSEAKFAMVVEGRRKYTTTCGQATFAWVPLKFPTVPKRGTFDVSRLRNSQYFFS